MGGAIPFNKSFTASSYGNSTELNLFNSTDGTSQLKYYVIYTEEMCLLTKLLHRSNGDAQKSFCKTLQMVMEEGMKSLQRRGIHSARNGALFVPEGDCGNTTGCLRPSAPLPGDQRPHALDVARTAVSD
ncbi:uncharacterized protein LOC144167231 isoform X1 [Haemaphysalis longicornis]